MSKTINNKKVVTREGYDTFLKELEHLKGVERIKTANAIKTASEQGDLSENAEYDAAKEAQALLEKRIFELEEFLKNCEIIDVENSEHITIGKTIVLRKIDTNESFTIKLVGNNEADPFSMKVSIASPTGHALLGKQIGDIITVEAPNAKITYEIVSVTIE